MTRIKSRFNLQYLCELFTVDVDDKETTSLIKCMPSSYKSALKSIDDIYQVFNQIYIESRKEGTLNYFVSDFL